LRGQGEASGVRTSVPTNPKQPTLRHRDCFGALPLAMTPGSVIASEAKQSQGVVLKLVWSWD